MAVTVRISDTAYRTLLDLAERERSSPEAVLECAIEQYRRRRFLEAANLQYASLRMNEAAWASELSERREWDGADGDG